MAKGIKRKLSKASKRVAKEISNNAAHGKFGAGLANEGYAGGFQQALQDVLQLLNGTEPSDNRGYWRN